jgi:murein DD-endopeptidase MepM/ murein hydrolase activator NlpD
LLRSKAPQPLKHLFFPVFLLFFLVSPSFARNLPWVEHSVRRGESVEAIAERYGVSPKTVERANELTADKKELAAGEKILVPKKEGDLLVTLAEVRARQRGDSVLHLLRREEPPVLSPPLPKKAAPRPENPFLRPLEGRISSPYGMRGRRLHDGVDIPAPIGTPILAARSGTVVFSGTIRGFGNTVTLDHGDGMTTRYSHNSANLVKKGDAVRQGQPIAKVGRTGRATCPHLHFSVLINGKTVNPSKYLR